MAQAYHASAVLLDALRQFEPKLEPRLEQMQMAAHRRSQQSKAAEARTAPEGGREASGWGSDSSCVQPGPTVVQPGASRYSESWLAQSG